LHDRTEGALPPEDERSWKSDDTSVAEVIAASETTTPVAGSGPDRFAPIPVSLTDGAAEILHTAADAEQTAEAAASVFEPAAGLSVGPVELEDPAAASMAAAQPSPFFVVEPVETLVFDSGGSADAAPVPFEVAGMEPVEVEIETAGAAALSAVVPDAAAVESAAAVSFDVGESLSLEAASLDLAAESAAFDDTHLAAAHEVHVDDDGVDWAGLATLTGDGSLDAGQAGPGDALATLSALEADGAGSSAGAPILPVASIRLDAIDETIGAFGSLEPEPSAVFAVPEGLDDIDEMAGQELADAIKALEDAAKRVEARLAPGPFRNEPAASPEHIAAYDFGPDPDATTSSDDHAASALLDTRQDGSFELVAPDLTDLSFGLEPAVEAEETGGGNDWTLESVADAPAFDFEGIAADEVGEAIGTAEAVGAPAEEGSSPVDSVLETAEDAVEVAPVADIDEVVEVVDTVLPVDAVDVDGWTNTVETAETADLVETADVASLVETTESVDTVEVADVEAVETMGVAEVAERAEVTAVVEVTEGEPPSEDTDEDLSLAAMVATELPGATVIDGERVDAGLTRAATTEPALEPADSPLVPAFEPEPASEAEPAPARHIYDSPVLAASATVAAVTAEVAALVAVDGPAALPMVGQVRTSARSPLVALERFLRKVQARQLELRGETVA
jgi:hypothetical protein